MVPKRWHYICALFGVGMMLLGITLFIIACIINRGLIFPFHQHRIISILILWPFPMLLFQNLSTIRAYRKNKTNSDS